MRLFPWLSLIELVSAADGTSTPDPAAAPASTSLPPGLVPRPTGRRLSDWRAEAQAWTESDRTAMAQFIDERIRPHYAATLAAGHLDREVSLVPPATNESPPSCAPQRVAVVRDDRAPGMAGRVLGVVHPDFRPLQNRDGALLFDQLFDQLFDPGARKYHTGGYLKHGEVVWLLARLPGMLRVNDKDVLQPYLLYTNSHDGSIAVDIRLTTVRVVCNNTLSLALAGGIDQAFRRRHRHAPATLAVDARAFFKMTRASVESTEQQFRHLAARPCDDAAFKRFLAKLLPDPARPATAARSRAVAAAYETRLARLAADRAAILGTRREGVPQCAVPPESPTWWGSLNAVTAWVDHLQPTAGDRYAHALFGSGDRLKSAAQAMAVVEAGIAA